MKPALKRFENLSKTCIRKYENSYNTRTLVLLDKAARIAREESHEDKDQESDFDLSWGSLQQEEEHEAEVNLLTKSIHVKKQVTFLKSVRQYDHIALSDYSEKEIRKCWYNADDKKKRTEKVEKIVSRMEKGKPAKGNITYQGLQGRTKEGRNLLDKNVMSVINAVMNEQDQQWAGNYDDVYRIAAQSRAASAECRSIARLTAMQDEREAREAWNDDCICRNELSPRPVTTDKESHTQKLVSQFKTGRRTTRNFHGKALTL